MACGCNKNRNKLNKKRSSKVKKRTITKTMPVIRKTTKGKITKVTKKK